MNYLEYIASRIKAQLPQDLRKYHPDLYLNLAALCRIKGTETTASDVHDFWNATRTAKNPGTYLIPFEVVHGLDFDEKYLPFVDAIRSVTTSMKAKRHEFEAILARADKLWQTASDQNLSLDDILQEMDEICHLVDGLAPKLYQNWIDAGDEYLCQDFIDKVIKPYRNLVTAQTPVKRWDMLRIFTEALSMLNWCLEYDGSNPNCPLWLSDQEVA